MLSQVGIEDYTCKCPVPHIPVSYSDPECSKLSEILCLGWGRDRRLYDLPRAPNAAAAVSQEQWADRLLRTAAHPPSRVAAVRQLEIENRNASHPSAPPR